MKKLFLLFIPVFSWASTDLAGSWMLKSGEASYSVSHTFKTVIGISKSLKGKGSCDKSGCEFLIATLVKDFDSDNSNRDTHMQKVTKAPEFPLVSVNVKSDSKSQSDKLLASYEITFAGKTKSYPKKEFKVTRNNKLLDVEGDLEIKLSDFDVERPSLLGVTVKDEVPLHVALHFEN